MTLAVGRSALPTRLNPNPTLFRGGSPDGGHPGRSSGGDFRFFIHPYSTGGSQPERLDTVGPSRAFTKLA